MNHDREKKYCNYQNYFKHILLYQKGNV